VALIDLSDLSSWMLGFFGTLSELFDGSLDSAKLGLVVSPTSGQASLVIFSWLSFMVVPGVSGLSVVSGVSDVHLSDSEYGVK